MAINPNNGVLDIINGVLKVTSIDIKQAGGFTTAINTVARNDVLLFDDQKTTTTFLPAEGSDYRSSTGFTRHTTALDFNDGWVYWPLQLPNSWHAEFDMLISSTGGVFTFSFFNTSEPNHTDYTANDGGYKIVFDNTLNKITIYFEGSAHMLVNANVRSSDWQRVVINYFHGAISISVAGEVVLNHEFTENYQEFDSRYVGFSATVGTSHKIRNLRIHNSDKWTYTNTANASHITYMSGNVGVGTLAPSEKLDVYGNVHVSRDLAVDGNLTVSGTTFSIDTTNLSVEDPIIELARGNTSDTIDSGLIMTRGGSNVAVTYIGDESELVLAYTQSGATDTEVTPIADGGLDVRVYGNLFANNLTTTANVEAAYLKGDGSELTEITLDQVVGYSNITANTIQLTNSDVGLKLTGNVEANYFVGDGSQLDNISATLQEITDNSNSTSNVVQFTNATTALIAESNVGIGTSLPAANLHVVGYQYVNDPPTQSASFDHSDAPLTLTHSTPTSTTAINDPKAVLHLTRDGTTNESYGARASFKLSRYENNGTASKSRLDVALTDGTYSESTVMTLRADGRVGIGTATPAYELDVVGNVRGDYFIGDGSGITNITSANVNDFGSNVSRIETLESGDMTIDGEKTFSSNLEVGTANLFVDTTTGRVGLGTTTPGYALDVHGTANVGALTATSVSGNGSGLTSLNADNLGSGTVPSARLSLAASDIPSLDASKITSGTLTRPISTTTGIFTSSGSAVLVGTGGKLGLTINDGDGNCNLTFNHASVLPDQDGSSGRIDCGVDNTTGYMRLRVKDNVTGGTSTGGLPECLRIQQGYVRAYSDFYADGNVGIGTNNPDKAKLQVHNTIALVNGSYKSVANDDQLAGKIEFFLGGTSNELATPVAAIEGYDKYVSGGSFSGAMAFKVYGTECMRIDPNGNVGIGVTSPGYKLDVAGTLHAGNSYFDNVYIGGSTDRGLKAVSGNYGTVQTTGSGAGSWEGYSIDGRYVFMSSDNTSCGIYNDIDNEWMIYCVRNAETRLYHNGGEKLRTQSYGMSVGGYGRFSNGNQQLAVDLGSSYYFVNQGGNFSWGGHPGVVRTNGNGEWRVHGEGSYNVAVRADGGHPTFTGSHDTFTPFEEEDIGKIVSSTGDYSTLIRDEVLHNVLTVMDSCPIVEITNIEKDKRVMGVLSKRIQSKEISEISSEEYTNLSENEKLNYEEKNGVWFTETQTGGFSKGYYNAVGEGGIWVSNKNGNLINGDYITSSTIPGYGQKQDEDTLKNYTVGKITCDCDFREIPIVKCRHVMIDGDPQYDENGKPIYENVLDENGDIITQLKFKLRYLLPDGTQITKEQYALEDEAYIAAFVGCTYHCG